MKYYFYLISVALVFSAYSRETSGKDISEILKEMNAQVQVAKEKMAELESSQTKTEIDESAKIIEQRRELFKQLAIENDKYNAEDLPEEERRIQSQNMERIVVKISSLSTEYLEARKNDLIFKDQQLALVEDALAGVVNRMDNLISASHQIDEESLEAKDQVDEMKKKLTNMAKSVEVLAKSSPDQKSWNSVKQTLIMQLKILNKQNGKNGKLQNILKTQKDVYDQSLAQVVLARQNLSMQKDLLQQVVLGTVAKTLLRKTANTLLGDHNIKDVGMKIFLDSEQKSNELVQFLEDEEKYDVLDANNDELSQSNYELDDEFSSIFNLN